MAGQEGTPQSYVQQEKDAQSEQQVLESRLLILRWKHKSTTKMSFVQMLPPIWLDQCYNLYYINNGPR